MCWGFIWSRYKQFYTVRNCFTISAHIDQFTLLIGLATPKMRSLLNEIRPNITCYFFPHHYTLTLFGHWCLSVMPQCVMGKRSLGSIARASHFPATDPSMLCGIQQDPKFEVIFGKKQVAYEQVNQRLGHAKHAKNKMIILIQKNEKNLVP